MITVKFLPHWFLFCLSVCLSVRPTDRPTVRPSVRPSVCLSVCLSVRPDLLVRSITLLFVDGIKNRLLIMFNIISRSVARIFRVHTSKVKVTIRGQRFENTPVLCINQMASFNSQKIHISVKAPWETCVFIENKL